MIIPKSSNRSETISLELYKIELYEESRITRRQIRSSVNSYLQKLCE